MAKSYRPVRRDQPFLLPPDMREWLPADHPVWLVIAAVGQLDTGGFHAGRRTGGAGAAGYDPDMLVLVLAWAYAHRVSSSRRIEELCRTDVAFRVICGGNLPDHATIARFRADFADAVAGFFAQVLALCARLGMGQLGVIALDGTKIAANASVAANRTGQQLAKLAAELVAAHGRADAAEDEEFGPGRRGDEVPPEAWSPRHRGERIAAALAELEAERRAAEEADEVKAAGFRARRQAGQRTGTGPLSAAVALAQENLERVRAARAAQLAELDERYSAGEPRRRNRAARIDDYCRVRAAAAKVEAARARVAAVQQNRAARTGPAPKRNITDPDSRLMPVRGGGFIQGYNAQNVTSEDGVIIATALTQDTTDTAWFEPMLDAAAEAARLIAAHHPAGDGNDHDHDGGPDGDRSTEGQEKIGLILADAGYCSEHNLTIPGPDRLIATGKHRDLEKAASSGGSAGWERSGTATLAMAERLKTDAGIAAYRQRGHIAETPHGNIKHNMGFRQLSLRGHRKASAEWTFTAAIANLLTAISSGHLTTTTLNNLTTT
jgi:transposase